MFLSNFVFSLFFLEDEFYVNPKHLNQQENGGVAVVTGRRVNQVDILFCVCFYVSGMVLLVCSRCGSVFIGLSKVLIDGCAFLIKNLRKQIKPNGNAKK